MRSEVYTVLENCKISQYIDVWTDYPIENRWGLRKINLEDESQQLWTTKGELTSMSSQAGLSTTSNKINMLAYRPVDVPIVNEAKRERHGGRSPYHSILTLLQHLTATATQRKPQS